MADFLQQLEQPGVFTQIRGSTFAYAGLLWMHIVALIIWGGAMVRTALSGPVEDVRRVKIVSFVFASVAGVLL